MILKKIEIKTTEELKTKGINIKGIEKWEIESGIVSQVKQAR